MEIKHDFGLQSQWLGLFKQLLIAALFAGWLVNIDASSKRFNRLVSQNKRLADFSYTLYLMHFPVLVFVMALLNTGFGVSFRAQPGVNSFLYFCGLLFVVYVVSFVFYF